MISYFVAPRSGEKSYKNFESTIKHGVPLQRISSYLNVEETKMVTSEEIIYAWGNRRGTVGSWNKMKPGDTVIFYANKRLVMTGEVYLKKHSPEMALALWPPDEKGNPWEYVFFLKNLRHISMPIEIFNDAVGYARNNIIQGFMPLGQERVGSIAQKYGSVEAMLNLFTDGDSKEIPQSHEKVYVNVPLDVKPELSTLQIKPLEPTLGAASRRKQHGLVDFEEKHKRNAKTGSLGEEIVLKFEKDYLISIGRKDLADQVTQLSLEDIFAGYDIVSYDANGNKKYIEVKSTSAKQSKSFAFYISRNEKRIAEESGNYYIYLVYNVHSSHPKIHIVEDPFKEGHHLTVEPISYRVKGTFSK